MDIGEKIVDFYGTGNSADWVKKEDGRHIFEPLDVFIDNDVRFTIALEIPVADKVTSITELDFEKDLPKVKNVILIGLDDEEGSFLSPLYEDEAPEELEVVRKFFLDGPTKAEWEEIANNI